MENLLDNIQLGAHIVGLILFVGVLPRALLNIFQEDRPKLKAVGWLIFLGIIFIIVFLLRPVLHFIYEGQPEAQSAFDNIWSVPESICAVGLGICSRLLFQHDPRPITQIIREVIFK